MIKREKWQTLKVYCSTETKVDLMNKAKASKLSLSKYLTLVGLGHEVKSFLDHERVAELAKTNADLGRLGGLLKLWLSDDKKIARFEPKTVRALLNRIEDTQAELRVLIHKILQ